MGWSSDRGSDLAQASIPSRLKPAQKHFRWVLSTSSSWRQMGIRLKPTDSELGHRSSSSVRKTKRCDLISLRRRSIGGSGFDRRGERDQAVRLRSVNCTLDENGSRWDARCGRSPVALCAASIGGAGRERFAAIRAWRVSLTVFGQSLLYSTTTEIPQTPSRCARVKASHESCRIAFWLP